MNWYVYIIKDPRNQNIFYVGKGKDYRTSATLYIKDKGCNHIKRMIIESIRNDSYEPIVEIVARFETENEALQFEKTLISKYGRIIKGTGQLANLSDGGDTSNAGWIPSENTRKIWSSQRLGRVQTKDHIDSRAKQLRGKKRTSEQKHNYVLASIRRTNPETKAMIIKELDNIEYKHGMYATLSKKFNVSEELISRIHNNLNLYKEALNEWLKK